MDVKLPRLKSLFVAALTLFALLYIAAAVTLAMKDNSLEVFEGSAATYDTIAIFGASGTAGDGILKAALANPEIKTIHVVTRRSTPRIEEGVASGKVKMTEHMDYLDYQAIEAVMVDAGSVYWAIGTSSLGVDEETYGMIHVDFPTRFVQAWVAVNDEPGNSFHYISSSDISADSSAMWAREKFRAEQTLFKFAEGTSLRTIAYRPDYIGPTPEEAHLGQNLLYWFFAPVGAGVRAEEIGRAMFEVTARGEEFDNGNTLSTRRIIQLSDSYLRRQQ